MLYNVIWLKDNQVVSQVGCEGSAQYDAQR